MGKDRSMDHACFEWAVFADNSVFFFKFFFGGEGGFVSRPIPMESIGGLLYLLDALLHLLLLVLMSQLSLLTTLSLTLALSVPHS